MSQDPPCNCVDRDFKADHFTVEVDKSKIRPEDAGRYLNMIKVTNELGLEVRVNFLIVVEVSDVS